ncbi:MAG: PD40 domain-containing protein [Phycisphaerales bacterium]|nr:MAG: PD40 domain-containing protein [Phycisphaerales bacterium]
MKYSDSSVIRMVYLVFAAVIVAGGRQNTRGDFVFCEPTNLGPPVNTSQSDGTPCISADDLSLYFTSNRSGGSGSHDLWVATRSSRGDNWSSPKNLGSSVNSSAPDYFPCISADELSLYFYSTRPGGRGGGDIWLTTRTSAGGAWKKAVNAGALINSAYEDVSPNLSSDGLTLLFASNRSGGYGNYDLYISVRDSQQSPWSAPTNLGPAVNSAHLDAAPSLSSDGLALVFHSMRPGGSGSYDLYCARRATIFDEWSAPLNLGSTVNSSYSELAPSLAYDGRSLYFSDHYMLPPRPGGRGIDDVWVVSIAPIVDFNGDRVVNLKDFSKLAQHWLQNEPPVDVAPAPLGDGGVDIRDVATLAEYWLQEIGLVAHWKLDETEGGIVHDHIGGNNGYGPPDLLWRPEGGKVGGALELDGIDDSLFTTFTLNPAAGPFSALVWIRGGGPGQVILSQIGGANWLYADPSEGKLITDLKGAGRFGGPLRSETVITDNEWHHVGLSWDGSTRTLYVDHLEVAKDTQTTLVGSEGAAQIGTGSAPVPGTFWAGLIDDVRIYRP